MIFCRQTLNMLTPHAGKINLKTIAPKQFTRGHLSGTDFQLVTRWRHRTRSQEKLFSSVLALDTNLLNMQY